MIAEPNAGVMLLVAAPARNVGAGGAASPPPARASLGLGPPEQGVILRGLYIGRAVLAVVVMIRSALVRDVAPELAFTGMMVVLTVVFSQLSVKEK